VWMLRQIFEGPWVSWFALGVIAGSNYPGISGIVGLVWLGLVVLWALSYAVYLVSSNLARRR